MRIALIALFAVTMFLWLLVLLGAVAVAGATSWLAWFAVLFLGIALLWDR
jgi:hypothetical protein